MSTLISHFLSCHVLYSNLATHKLVPRLVIDFIYLFISHTFCVSAHISKFDYNSI